MQFARGGSSGVRLKQAALIRRSNLYGIRHPRLMGSTRAAVLIALFVVMHQDFWFWTMARPLVFGFMPIGLFYHAAYTVACAGLMALLVRWSWPAHLEAAADRSAPRR